MIGILCRHQYLRLRVARAHRTRNFAGKQVQRSEDRSNGIKQPVDFVDPIRRQLEPRGNRRSQLQFECRGLPYVIKESALVDVLFKLELFRSVLISCLFLA
jgi:hypothetical protein